MGPQNAIMGDDNYGTDLPVVDIPDDTMEDLKRMARFSKTAEYKILKEYVEGRVKFYKTQLPDGRPLSDVDATERGNMWVVANAVIGEMEAILGTYDEASRVVKEAAKSRNA